MTMDDISVFIAAKMTISGKQNLLTRADWMLISPPTMGCACKRTMMPSPQFSFTSGPLRYVVTVGYPAIPRDHSKFKGSPVDR